MNRRAFLALIPLAPAALAACATAQTADTPPRAQRFAGLWDFHFETSSFRTHQGAGPYWLAADGDVWAELTAPFAPTGHPWGTLDIIIEGILSAPGRYGHLGAYERELTITRIISTRLHQGGS